MMIYSDEEQRLLEAIGVLRAALRAMLEAFPLRGQFAVPNSSKRAAAILQASKALGK